jgi:hypothetical protein
MRQWVVLSALLALLLSAAPVSAATSTFHFSFAGRGAEGFWGTFGDNTFEGAFVSVAEQVTREDGTRLAGTVLFFDHFQETCGRRSCSGSFTFGFVENVPFSIDSKLTQASVDVTVNATRCTFDRQGETCSDVQTRVAVTWTGAGDLIRFHGANSGGQAGSFQFTSHSNGSVRPAVASGSVDGFSIDGATESFADMFNVRSGDTFVCHNGCFEG